MSTSYDSSTTIYCLLPTLYCLLFTGFCLLPTGFCLLLLFAGRCVLTAPMPELATYRNAEDKCVQNSHGAHIPSAPASFSSQDRLPMQPVSVTKGSRCNRSAPFRRCFAMGQYIHVTVSLLLLIRCLRFTKLCWVGKHMNIIMKPTNSPTQGQPNLRKYVKNGIRVIFAHSK